MYNYEKFCSCEDKCVTHIYGRNDKLEQTLIENLCQAKIAKYAAVSKIVFKFTFILFCLFSKSTKTKP